jgi:hypothetical protein
VRGQLPRSFYKYKPYLISFRRLQTNYNRILPQQQYLLFDKYESTNVNPEHFTFRLGNSSLINSDLTSEDDGLANVFYESAMRDDRCSGLIIAIPWH